MSVKGFWVLDFLTLPWFLGEVRGFSKMYEGIENSPFKSIFGQDQVGSVTRAWWGGVVYILLSSAFFLWFTDLCIYFVHRWLHWPAVYKRLHKPHHKWVIPTPFASHAFNPFDGYLQSVPYHLFVYLFPLHKYTYLGLFCTVNLWSIFIHDSDMIVGHPLEKIINGPAHHTLHHMYFVYNYGQYFTWADKVGGSYRHPKTEDDPLHAILQVEEAKERYKQEKEEMRLLHEREIAAASTSSTSSSLLASSSISPLTSSAVSSAQLAANLIADSSRKNTSLLVRRQQIRRGSEYDDDDDMTMESSASSTCSGTTSPAYSRSDSGFEDTNSDKESKEMPLLRKRK